MIYTSDSLEFLKSRNEFEFDINYSDPPYALGSEIIIRPDGKVDYKKAINKLNTICSNDQEIIECLEQSIINGWTGLFEVKKSNKQEKVKIKGSGLGNISDLYD